MVNTDPKCYWLTNYLETLLVEVWYPMTVATNSREQKKLLHAALGRTGGSTEPSQINFMLHDWIPRRVVGRVGGHWRRGPPGQLLGNGHDGGAAVRQALLRRRHRAAAGRWLSIPAAEHSTITSWGREGELDAFKNMLTQYPEGLVAVVSDSYNVFEACEKYWGGELREMIKRRGANGGRLVVRPDSGDPLVIVPQLLDILGKAFAEDVTRTSTGHRVLPPYIRMIQGDGISYESLGAILDAMGKAGWAAENLAFGSGGALLQKLNRDTQKCAFKCSEIVAGGAARPVYKDPITDKGKRAKRQLTLERDSGAESCVR